MYPNAYFNVALQYQGISKNFLYDKDSNFLLNYVIIVIWYYIYIVNYVHYLGESV